jgi:hypothetical protein
MIKNQSFIPYIAESLLYCTALVAWCTHGNAVLQSTVSHLYNIQLFPACGVNIESCQLEGG